MATERSEGALSVTTRPSNARTLDCPHPLRRRLPLTDGRPLRLRRRLPRDQAGRLGGDRAERGSTEGNDATADRPHARLPASLAPHGRSTPLTDDRPLRVRRRLPREQGGDRAERGSTGSSSRARLLR